MLGLALVVVLSAFTLLPAREDHVGKHIEAPIIRARYRNGLCDEVRIYYAPTSGRLLILCRMSSSKPVLWGGIIYKVTELVHDKITPMKNAREWSVFASTWHYWQGKITQGQYRLIADFPTVEYFARSKGWIR